MKLGMWTRLGIHVAGAVIPAVALKVADKGTSNWYVAAAAAGGFVVTNLALSAIERATAPTLAVGENPNQNAGTAGANAPN